MTKTMDNTINDFPMSFTSEASCWKKSNFHRKTREVCMSADSVSLKVAKCIVVGDLSVGKTSVITRYCHNVFEKSYKPTIGVDYELLKYEILKQDFHLQIWDTSGEERFKCITGAYYRGAHVVIVAFDLTSMSSLLNSRQWLDDAMNKCKTTTPFVFLVGNKRDLTRNISKDITSMSIDLANQLNAEYWEVSAKTEENVKRFFERVAALCFDQAVLKETENLLAANTQIGSLQLSKRKEPLETITLKDEGMVVIDEKKKITCCK